MIYFLSRAKYIDMEKDVNSDLVLKLGVVFQVNGLLKIYFTVIVKTRIESPG